ncbi:MAG: hypothetical protein ACMG55_15705 [Microcoleus sp.]
MRSGTKPSLWYNALAMSDARSARLDQELVCRQNITSTRSRLCL